MSCYLKTMDVRCLQLGLQSIVECQTKDVCEQQESQLFYMCRSCQKTIQQPHIHNHIINGDHQYRDLFFEHSKILFALEFGQIDWSEDKITSAIELAVTHIAKRERCLGLDMEVKLLDRGLCVYVQTVPFIEGIQIVDTELTSRISIPGRKGTISLRVLNKKLGRTV